MPTKLIIAIASLIVAMSTARAEVTSAGQNGFTITSSADVPVPPAQAFEQFLQAGQWWNLDHSWFGKTSTMSIEAKVGGCFCERNGDREVEHMRVVHVEPGKEIRLIGGLGPLRMMGLHGAMAWSFESTDKGGTKITQVYAVSGYSKDGLQNLAPIVDGVQTEQLSRLISLLSDSASK